jgi:hypothetical protein
VKWALPRSYEPVYQTTKLEKKWDEMRFSEVARATKHTLCVLVGFALLATRVTRVNPTMRAPSLFQRGSDHVL